MLEDGVHRLALGGAAAIVMPCNTLQAYLPEIVARAGLPYIHLIREVVRHIQQRGYRRVAVVCSSSMRSLGLYQAELDTCSVPYLLPTESEQDDITATILDTLHARRDPNARLGPVLRHLETV